MILTLTLRNLRRKGHASEDRPMQTVAEMIAHLTDVYPEIEIEYMVPAPTATRKAPVLSVYQDGARFYANDHDGPVYIAPDKVPDGDMEAAIRARDAMRAWAKREYGEDTTVRFL